MYYVKKRMEISASHCLALNYESPCGKVHGHNWIVTVYCESEKLNENGMILDFSEIKKTVHGRLDHECLNELLSFNPTAENIARWIVENTPFCYKATVEETEGNEASYEISGE